MFDYSKRLVNGEVLNGDRVATLMPAATEDPFEKEVAPLPFADADFQMPQPDVADVPVPERTLDYSWQMPLQAQIAEWLTLFVQKDQVVELRALKVPEVSGAAMTWSGFYKGDKLESMARDAMELTEAEGVYFTLNPLNATLLAVRNNRCARATDTAKDEDVTGRRWLLIDADPVRRAGISSSQEEKNQAWKVVREVNKWLQGLGWSDPILADSGNGYHLLYPINLPGDDGGLVKRVLVNLAERFDTATVKVDTNVFNPGRIVKLYGSVARKGDSVRERPHRRTGVLYVPKQRVIVTRQQLQQVGGEERKPPVSKVQSQALLRASTLYQGIRSDQKQRARKYLDKMPGAVSGAGGSNQTFKAACRLVEIGLDDDDAMEVFREWNSKCEPPWTEKDLRKKLHDARLNVTRPRSVQLDGQQAGSEPLNDNLREYADDPHRLAEIYLKQRRVEGMSTVVFWNGDWYRWNGAAYVVVSENEIKAEVTRAIKEEFDQLNRVERLGASLGDPQAASNERQLEQTPEPRVRKVTTAVLGNVMQALRSICHLPGNVAFPCWLDGEGPVPASEVLVGQNGWIHLPSFVEGNGALKELTPNLFTTASLDYDIGLDAPAPATWLQFLEQLFPDDPESIALLQEWFGYCLSQDTRQQKMLLIVGPMRAGKGTIARVLKNLVGDANVAGPTTSNLASNFGLSALITKPVAVIADARFGGRAADQAIVVERLLSISGEDTLTIDRKNKEHLSLKLPTRFMILTNEVPRFTDASTALPKRLLTLQLSRSWYGNEDVSLGDKLLQERAGILRWACDGLKRLKARGRFEQPASGAETISRMVELASPVTSFVRERCELGADKAIAKATLFENWRTWCRDNGHEPGSLATFSRNLQAAFAGIQVARNGPRNFRIHTFQGLAMARFS